MTKKLTKVAMTTALAAAAIVPAVVATPAQAAEAEVTFAKAYYTTANGTAAFEAGKLAGVIGATSNTKVTYAEGSNGEVFPMSAFSAYLAVNPTATTDEVLTALSTAGKALSADQVKALDVKEGQVDGGKVTVDPTAVQKTALNEAIAKAEASPKAAELKDAIAAAKAVAENADATQAEVDAAVKALNEAVAEAEAVTELKVESVKAINATSVKVTFNQEVETLAKADVVVTNKATAAKQYVKSVTLAEDGLSATVELYEALETKNTYNLSATVGENTVSKEFDFVVGGVAKIEAETTQVVKGSATFDLTTLDYKVLDEAGLDITKGTTVTFETTGTAAGGANQINLTAGNSAFVYVVAKKADGTEVKSPRITVKAEASKPVAITNYSVATTGSAPDFDADNYKQSLTVQKGDTAKSIFAEAENQFGDVFGGSVTFESLDKTIALVDKATGAITPLKEGTVPVKITAGTGTDAVTKTVELKVVADAKVTSIETDKAEVSVSNSVTSPTQVKVTTRDQYNNEFNGGTAAVKVISGSDLVTGVSSTLDLSSGTANLGVTGVAGKSGTAVIEIKVSDTIKTTVKVNVIAASAVDGYIVEDFETSLDKNASNADTESEMTLKAFPVDVNGVKTGNEAAATYTVKDKDGEVVTELQDVQTNTAIKAANANLKAGETYTVTVKVGTIEVFTKTFKVVDTAPKPVVEQKTSKIAADVNENIFAAIKGAFKVTFEGATQDNYELVDLTYLSDNTSVIAAGTDATGVTTITEGTATLAISTITIDLDGDTVGTTDDQYEVTVDSLINVTVVDEAAAALATINAGTATLEDYTAAGINNVTADNLEDVNTAVAAEKASKGSDLTSTEVDAVVLLATQKALLGTLTEAKFTIVNINTKVGYTDDATFLAAALALNTLTALGTKDVDYSVTVTAFTAATNDDDSSSQVNGKYTIEFTLADGVTKVTFTDAEITATTAS